MPFDLIRGDRDEGRRRTREGERDRHAAFADHHQPAARRLDDHAPVADITWRAIGVVVIQRGCGGMDGNTRRKRKYRAVPLCAAVLWLSRGGGFQISLSFVGNPTILPLSLAVHSYVFFLNAILNPSCCLLASATACAYHPASLHT